MLFHPTRKRIIRRSASGSARAALAELPELLHRVYTGRQITQPDELDLSLARLPPPWSLSGMEAMVEQLIGAIRNRDHIMILADYDADGATACAVAVRGLRQLGAAHVSYLVPNRFEYGYGLTPEIVTLARQRRPDVMVTVDNGIASLAGTLAAKAAGIRVLITDHHLPGHELPAADAIVNPHLPGDLFPGKSLAGVGVLFYVLIALRSKLRCLGGFASGTEEPNLAELLDYVALGTIADMVPFDRVNRILVHQGLQRLRSGAGHAGIAALLETAGRQPATITAEDLGFAVAPRLNAAGRLDDMGLGIACLLSDEPGEAREKAERLHRLNGERRAIEERMRTEALSRLRELEESTAGTDPPGLCLFDEAWHQGVVGLVASRIKDRVHRPVIAFAKGNAGELKGSARSIPGVHIRDLLCDIAAEHPVLLTKFGGHALAAGLSLRCEDLDRFRELFAHAVEKRLQGIELEHVIQSDGELRPEHFSIATAETLKRAGPWGQAFPEPVFDGAFRVRQARTVGDNHIKLTLHIPGTERAVDGIAFFVENPCEWLHCENLRAAFRLDVNEFRDSRNLQLKIEYMESEVLRASP